MRPDDLVLGFDTSAAHCAAALLRGDEVLAERDETLGRGQAERLFPMLGEILAEAGANWHDLTRIGVGIGPGNFTGIRIAVAAARGLALSLGRPAVGVSMFEALGEGQEGRVLASVDARAGRLYLQFGSGAPVLTEAGVIDPPEGAVGAICIGHRASELARLTGGTQAAPRYPLAVAVARLAARAALPQARPAPLYLRPADAALPAEPPPRLLA